MHMRPPPVLGQPAQVILPSACCAQSTSYLENPLPSYHHLSRFLSCVNLWPQSLSRERCRRHLLLNVCYPAACSFCFLTTVYAVSEANRRWCGPPDEVSVSLWLDAGHGMTMSGQRALRNVPFVSALSWS